MNQCSAISSLVTVIVTRLRYSASVCAGLNVMCCQFLQHFNFLFSWESHSFLAVNVVGDSIILHISYATWPSQQRQGDFRVVKCAIHKAHAHAVPESTLCFSGPIIYLLLFSSWSCIS